MKKERFRELWMVMICTIWAAVLALSGMPGVLTVQASPAPETAPKAEPARIENIRLLATGDLLMHNTVINSGQTADGYDYSRFFAPLESMVAEADYASICMETPLAGAKHGGYTGYPMFNAPDALAVSLRAAGFDLVITAHNHCLDRGVAGLQRTLEVLRQQGLDTLGTNLTPEEQNSFLIKDLKGIKVGYIGYTYGTNGIAWPQDQAYLINVLDPDRILADISRLRPQVDVLVLILHWGQEYQHLPTKEQQQQAADFLLAGADIIIGSHPHVVQPAREVTLKGKKKFVIFSMGNSLSHQRGLERNSGVVVSLELEKNFSTGLTVLRQVELTPTFSHSYSEKGRQRFQDVPIEAAQAAVKSGNYTGLGTADLPVLQQSLQETRGYLQGELPYFEAACAQANKEYFAKLSRVLPAWMLSRWADI